jgi:hypothetical protein
MGFTTMRKKTKRFVKTLHRPTTCDSFCKKDFEPFLEKRIKKVTGKHRSRSDKVFSYDVCRKTFCNGSCQGYDRPIRHKKGFQKEYTPRQVERFKQRGAISGCVYIYPEDYNVFHD